MRSVRPLNGAVGRQDTAVPPRPDRRRDRGSVLLETALAIPLLLAVTMALTWCIGLAATSMSLSDTARTVARELARGEAIAEVLARAESASPGAAVRLEDAAGMVRVVVDREVTAPVPILRGLSVTISRSVAIPREWT